MLDINDPRVTLRAYRRPTCHAPRFRSNTASMITPTTSNPPNRRMQPFSRFQCSCFNTNSLRNLISVSRKRAEQAVLLKLGFVFVGTAQCRFDAVHAGEPDLRGSPPRLQ